VCLFITDETFHVSITIHLRYIANEFCQWLISGDNCTYKLLSLLIKSQCIVNSCGEVGWLIFHLLFLFVVIPQSFRFVHSGCCRSLISITRISISFQYPTEYPQGRSSGNKGSQSSFPVNYPFRDPFQFLPVFSIRRCHFAYNLFNSASNYNVKRSNILDVYARYLILSNLRHTRRWLAHSSLVEWRYRGCRITISLTQLLYTCVFRHRLELLLYPIINNH